MPSPGPLPSPPGRLLSPFQRINNSSSSISSSGGGSGSICSSSSSSGGGSPASPLARGSGSMCNNSGGAGPTSPLARSSGSPGPMWLGPRINGVRPELIGGEMKPPGQLPRPMRPAPTVIMGEAGGVRTMIWSQPTGPDPSPSTSTWGGPSSTGASDEAAAQLLLTLGQAEATSSRCAEAQQTQQPLQPPPQPQQQPLNMERLWAGDISQLPASQQLHALNLTAPPLPTPWAQRNGGPSPSVSSEQPKLPFPMTVMPGGHEEVDEDEQPMICMICEDKATGLHYGIITCEGSVFIPFDFLYSSVHSISNLRKSNRTYFIFIYSNYFPSAGNTKNYRTRNYTFSRFAFFL